MSEVKMTPVEIGNGIGFRGIVSISDEELKNRVNFLEEHEKEISKLIIKTENELYIKELLQRNNKLKKELDQYKTNWKELKKEMNRSDLSYIETQFVLDKMEEIEKNNK